MICVLVFTPACCDISAILRRLVCVFRGFDASVGAPYLDGATVSREAKYGVCSFHGGVFLRFAYAAMRLDLIPGSALVFHFAHYMHVTMGGMLW